MEQIGGERNSIRLARGKHIRRFLEVPVMDEERRRSLVEELCRGISRLETLPRHVLGRPGVVPLKIAARTPVETSFWVEKPLERFILTSEDAVSQAGLEMLHRYVFLRYRYGDGRMEALRLNYELFHVLLELSEGYQLADAFSGDTFAHLSIFTQRLGQKDEQQLCAWNPSAGDKVYRVHSDVQDRLQRLHLSRD